MSNETPLYFKRQYFQNVEANVIGYNDGMASRSRNCKLLLYVQNKIYEFAGSSIDGVCVVKGSKYNKNGKWSATDYTIQLGAGVKHSKITQGWDSGKYIDNVETVQSMAKDLGLEGVQMSAVTEFIKEALPKAWARHVEFNEKIDALEEAAEAANAAAPLLYTYDYHRINRRTGMNYLLIDGAVWDFSESERVKILKNSHSSGMGGGNDVYELLIAADALVEELPECSPYDDGADSLETRGYVCTDGVWTRPVAVTRDGESSTPPVGETAMARALREAKK